MDENAIFAAVDQNRDSGIDYVEMSRAIYHSQNTDLTNLKSVMWLPMFA